MDLLKNENGLELFSSEEKIRCFDKMAKLFYDCNFGSSNKADIELLMFSFYLKQLVDNGMNYDDYSISKQLGITESRVRSLKMRNQLIYPRQNDWIKLFFRSLENVELDEEENRIVLSVNEVTVMTELQHYVDVHKGQYGKKLNSKQITFRIGFFFNMLGNLLKETNADFDKDEFVDTIFEKLNENYHENKDSEKIITRENWQSRLKANALPAILDLMKQNPKTSTIAVILDAAIYNR